MATHLFQALTLGLLLVIVLVLLVLVSMLGKVRAALETRRSDADAPTPTDEVDGEPDAGAEQARDEVVLPEAEAEPLVLADPSPEALPDETPEPATGLTDESVESLPGGEPDSERPYEEGGRWYFRRGGELLVYEEGTGEWVPAPEPQPAVAGQAEAIAASDEPAPAEDAAAPAAAASDFVVEVPARGPSPSTSFGGQPVALVEDDALGDVDVDPDAAGLDETTAGFGVVETAARDRTSESFWKCPSCGAVNGSTATSCRMCFSARP